ncbi:MAG: hypothetical protein DRO11_06130, partial [Methanobacteriota archaeon]
ARGVLLFLVKVLSVDPTLLRAKLEIVVGAQEAFKAVLGEGEAKSSGEVGGRKYTIKVVEILYDEVNPRFSEVVVEVSGRWVDRKRKDRIGVLGRKTVRVGEDGRRSFGDAVVVEVYHVGEANGEKKAHIKAWIAPFTSRDIKIVEKKPRIALKYSFSRTAVSKGDRIEVNITLENEGTEKAKEIEFKMDIPKGLLLIVGRKTWQGALKPGEKHTMKISLKGVEPGSHQLKMSVDYVDMRDKTHHIEKTARVRVGKGVVIEFKKNDGKVGTTTETKEKPPTLEKLQLRKGEELKITVTAKNVGESTAKSLKIEDPIPEKTIVTQGQNVVVAEKLEPGKSFDVTYTLRAMEPGEYTLGPAKLTYVDHQGINHAIRTKGQVTLLVTGTPVLEFVRQVSRTEVDEGEELTLTYMVRNTGDDTAFETTLKQELPPGLEPAKTLEKKSKAEKKKPLVTEVEAKEETKKETVEEKKSGEGKSEPAEPGETAETAEVPLEEIAPPLDEDRVFEYGLGEIPPGETRHLVYHVKAVLPGTYDIPPAEITFKNRFGEERTTHSRVAHLVVISFQEKLVKQVGFIVVALLATIIVAYMVIRTRRRVVEPRPYYYDRYYPRGYQPGYYSYGEEYGYEEHPQTLEAGSRGEYQYPESWRSYYWPKRYSRPQQETQPVRRLQIRRKSKTV